MKTGSKKNYNRLYELMVPTFKMTRKAHLEPYLSVTELKHRYRSATNPIEARRWQLLWLYQLTMKVH